MSETYETHMLVGMQPKFPAIAHRKQLCLHKAQRKCVSIDQAPETSKKNTLHLNVIMRSVDVSHHQLPHM